MLLRHPISDVFSPLIEGDQETKCQFPFEYQEPIKGDSPTVPVREVAIMSDSTFFYYLVSCDHLIRWSVVVT